MHGKAVKIAWIQGNHVKKKRRKWRN